MKKILIAASLIVSSSFVYAQSNKEEIDLIQSAFGMEKKALAAEFIKLDGPAKDAFWVIYDEYETKRKELGRKRMELLDKYVASYTTLNDESTDGIIKEIMDMQGQNDKLIETYYAKVKKASGSKAAAQFYQFENYILAKIRAMIMENIPLIGEFDKHKK